MHGLTLGGILTLNILTRIFIVGATPTLFHPRQLPAEPNDIKTILTPSGVQVRYKEPGKAGVCETTPGVNSYSGYVDLAPDAHTFFWFFEARHQPAEAPITLWLNGGPGSDSLIGLFQGEPVFVPSTPSQKSHQCLVMAGVPSNVDWFKR